MKKFVSLFLLLPILIASQNIPKDEFIRLNLSNITSSYGSNGLTDYNYDGVKGFYYPKNNNYAGIWWSGLVIGGKVNEELRVTGSTFISGMVNSEKALRVRRDYKNGDLSSEINEGEGTETEIRAKYESAWNNWDYDNADIYEDINQNGKYEPEIDIPGVKGAAQTILFKINDFDNSLVQQTFGSNQLNVEVDVIIWNYINHPVLENTIFRKYVITNKGNERITDLYCGFYSDPDIGNPSDDLVGCDSSLQLAYCYNSKANDIVLGNNVYALGYLIFNKKQSAFNFFINGDNRYNFPEMGSYSGALHFYNLMQGKLEDGSQYQTPAQYGGGETSFPLSGDPVNHTGWLDGAAFSPGNRNLGLSAKLNNILLPGERVSILIAQIVAGGNEGVTYLEAIDTLKNYANYIFEHISDFPVKVESNRIKDIPTSFDVYQNYPNPFNPTTTISFALPQSGNIKLIVYDALGREAARLADGMFEVGKHNIKFDGSNLSSGIYFYRIITPATIITKKMILVK